MSSHAKAIAQVPPAKPEGRTANFSCMLELEWILDLNPALPIGSALSRSYRRQRSLRQDDVVLSA
jgi:hypothetical protein